MSTPKSPVSRIARRPIRPPQSRRLRAPSFPPLPTPKLPTPKLPTLKLPAVHWPEVRWPEVHWPDVHWPDVHWPDVHWPDGIDPRQVAAPAGIAARQIVQRTNPADPYRLLREILGPDLATATAVPVAAPADARWSECEPDEVGMDPAGVNQAIDLVHRRGAAAQLCVLRYGRVVVQHSTGCPPDALFWLFSVSKSYIVVLTHQLIERGVLELDAPVARHWPEFGRHGKEAITLRHVLQHRTGFATTGSAVRDLAYLTDWQQMITAIADTRPLRAPGGAPAYQFAIFGFILGEVMQRVTGRSLSELLRTEILEPLGATNTFLGIDAELWQRHVPVEFRHPGGELGARAVNRLSTRQAVVPSAGVSATAADVARLYQMLLDGGRVGDRRLISPRTVKTARTVTTHGEVDRFCHVAVPWSLGFQLGGDRGPGKLIPMGTLSSRNTFGHNGSNCCIAWADTDRELVFVYLANQRSGWNADVVHLSAVADAILRACD